MGATRQNQMPYDNPESGMGENQQASPDVDTGSQQQPAEEKGEAGGYTCFLPGDFPGAENLKAGDTLQLKVVGKDADGDIEVEHMQGGEGEKPEGKGMMDYFDEEVGSSNKQ